MDLLMELLDSTETTGAAAQVSASTTAPPTLTTPLEETRVATAVNDRASEASTDKRIKEGGT